MSIPDHPVTAFLAELPDVSYDDVTVQGRDPRMPMRRWTTPWIIEPEAPAAQPTLPAPANPGARAAAFSSSQASTPARKSSSSTGYSGAGVGSGFGYRAGLAYVAGLWAGNNIVAGLVISGIAAAALALPWLRVALLWGSVLYLLWLAAKIAFAGPASTTLPPSARQAA